MAKHQQYFFIQRIFENVDQDKDKFAENSDEIVLFWLEKSLLLFFFSRNMTPLKRTRPGNIAEDMFYSLKRSYSIASEDAIRCDGQTDEYRA